MNGGTFGHFLYKQCFLHKPTFGSSNINERQLEEESYWMDHNYTIPLLPGTYLPEEKENCIVPFSYDFHIYKKPVRNTESTKQNICSLLMSWKYKYFILCRSSGIISLGYIWDHECAISKIELILYRNTEQAKSRYVLRNLRRIVKFSNPCKFINHV